MSRPTIARPLRLLPCRRARSSACRNRRWARRSSPAASRGPSSSGWRSESPVATARARPRPRPCGRSGWRRSRRRPARSGRTGPVERSTRRLRAESRPGRCCRGRSSIRATPRRRCRAHPWRRAATRPRPPGRRSSPIFRSCRTWVGKPPGSTLRCRRHHARPRRRLPRRRRRAAAPSRIGEWARWCPA